MAKEQKLPSLSKFKHDIYDQPYFVETILPSIPFPQAIQLLVSNNKLARDPLDEKTGQLKLWWDVFLDHHWQAFILHNVLSNFKRFYKWDNQTVLVIVDKLRTGNRKWQEKVGIRFPPTFYIPTRFLVNRDEELVFLYAQITGQMRQDGSDYNYLHFIFENGHDELNEEFEIEIVSNHYEMTHHFSGQANFNEVQVETDDAKMDFAERVFILLRRMSVEGGQFAMELSAPAHYQNIRRKNNLSKQYHFDVKGTNTRPIFVIKM